MPQQPPALDETVRLDPSAPDDRARADRARIDRAVTARELPEHADTAPVGTPPVGAAGFEAEADDTQDLRREPGTGTPDADRTVRLGNIAVDVAPATPATPEPAAAADETARLNGGPSGRPPLTRSQPAAGPAPHDTQRVAVDRSPVERPVVPVPVPAAAEPDLSASASSATEPVAVPRESLACADGPGRRAWWRRRAVLVPAAAAAVLGGAYGVDLLVSEGSIPRHTVVDGVQIGGLSPSAAEHVLQTRLAPRIAAGRTVLAADVHAPLSPTAAGLTLDARRTVQVAGEQPLNPWTRLVTLFADRPVTAEIATKPAALTTGLNAVAQQVDHPAVDATIGIDGTTPHVVPPADGRALDRRGAESALRAALAAGGDPGRAIRLPVRVTHPHVQAATAQRVLDGTVRPALSAPVDLVGQDGGHRTQIPVAAIAASLTFTPKADGSLAVGVDPAKLQAALGSQLAVFGTPATDAHFQVSGDTIHVVPSVDGTGVDPAALARQLLPVFTHTGQRTVTAQLGPVKAAFTTEQAQALGITEKVSSFTTNFSMSPSATNIRVVAEKVNGALVKPGETFSLNGFTGTRGSAQGYIPAPVIEGGQLTNAVGGGISQFATTMFNAAFFAGVQDVHHQPHSFYISRYPAGREATVFDGLIDLVWKNDSNTGIYVQTQWISGGSLTVTFWGTKHYQIESISSDKRNMTEPPVMEKPDDGKCIPMAGAQGFDITVTRVFHDLGSGAVVKKENFNTHYQPEAILHCVKPATPAVPPGPGG